MIKKYNLLESDFIFTKIVTKSEKKDCFILIPSKYNLPSKLTIFSDKWKFYSTIDSRNRIYANSLFEKLKIEIGTEIKFSRKNGKYYFSTI